MRKTKQQKERKKERKNERKNEKEAGRFSRQDFLESIKGRTRKLSSQEKLNLYLGTSRRQANRKEPAQEEEKEANRQEKESKLEEMKEAQPPVKKENEKERVQKERA